MTEFQLIACSNRNRVDGVEVSAPRIWSKQVELRRMFYQASHNSDAPCIFLRALLSNAAEHFQAFSASTSYRLAEIKCGDKIVEQPEIARHGIVFCDCTPFLFGNRVD